MSDWRDLAECKGMNTDDWYPERGSHPQAVRALIAICNACPVRPACLTDAINTHDIDYGVRGGMSVNARQREYARRRAEGTAA